MMTERPTSATATTTMPAPQVRNSRARTSAASAPRRTFPRARSNRVVIRRWSAHRARGSSAAIAPSRSRRPRRGPGRGAARRAERHVGYDVVAVRTQHRLVGVDLVVFFVKQCEVKADAQQQKRHHGHREMNDQLQPLRDVRDVDEPQPGVHSDHGGGEHGEHGTHVSRMLMGLAGGRVNHSAAPRARPTAAAVTGTAMPRMPASTISDATGRARATMPEANCGASRVMVAAAVKVNVPRAPIMKPSNDSRFGGRSRRTTTTGTSMSSMLPTGTPSPSLRSRPAAIPVPSGTPYERATAAPVNSTQPTPSVIPSPAVRSRVRTGDRDGIGLPQVQQEQQRQPECGDGDQRRGHPQRRERDQRHQHEDQHDPKRRAGFVRQVREQRTRQRRQQQVLARSGPVGANRNQDGPFPRRSVRWSPQSPQNSPAGTSV